MAGGFASIHFSLFLKTGSFAAFPSFSPDCRLGSLFSSGWTHLLRHCFSWYLDVHTCFKLPKTKVLILSFILAELWRESLSRHFYLISYNDWAGLAAWGREASYEGWWWWRWGRKWEDRILYLWTKFMRGCLQRVNLKILLRRQNLLASCHCLWHQWVTWVKPPCILALHKSRGNLPMYSVFCYQ